MQTSATPVNATPLSQGVPSSYKIEVLGHAPFMTVDKYLPGILSSVLPKFVKSCVVHTDHGDYQGVGLFRNLYTTHEAEFYAPGMAHPVTVGAPKLTVLRHQSRERSRHCSVFFDFVDYLAFKSHFSDSRFAFHQADDAILISDPANFFASLIECDLYDDIYCFFPHTLAGKTAWATYHDRFDRVVHDCSVMYDKFSSLYDYVKQLSR